MEESRLPQDAAAVELARAAARAEFTALAFRAREAYREGDRRAEQNAWERLDEIRHALFRHALWRLDGDEDAAVEVTAQTLFGLFKFIRGNKPIDDAGALAWKILHRRIADLYRQRQKEVMPPDSQEPARNTADGPDPSEIALDRAMVNKVLDSLPPDQRRILVMRFGLGYAVRDIAERTGLTEDQVKKRTQKAMRIVEEVRRREFNLEPGA